MQLPNWLAGLTGANKFANNPANGFAATFGDMLQGAGHSMAQHYRGEGGKYGGPSLIAGLNANLSTPASRPPAETLASVLPSLGPISGQGLAPLPGASGLDAAQPQVLPPPPPASLAPNPQLASALAAQLNGGGPSWGQSAPAPAAAPAPGGIPLGLLLQLGLGRRP